MLSALEDALGVSNLGSQCFKKHDAAQVKKAVKGAVVGGAAGGAIGGAAAYLEGKYEISRQPVDAVNLQWSEPILQEKTLGEIPKGYYAPGAGGKEKFGDRGGHVPVTARAPLLDADGYPLMKLQMKVFSGHGESQVDWQTHKITNPALTGFEEHVSEDAHYHNIGSGCSSFTSRHRSFDSNCFSVRRVHGYYHTFTPTIEETVVGEYRTPEVTFETGVDLVSRTLWGLLVGIGVGALSGAILAAIGKKNQAKGGSRQP